MAWMFLIIGGLLEIAWALGLKYSNGFSLLLPSMITIVLIASSFYFFAKAIKLIPIGTAYAIFTGIGAAGTAIIGMVFLEEPVSFLKIFFILLLLSCVIGLKLTNHEKTASTNEQESLQS
ncbi:quaternary ammonium compound-resistance protein SugE [Bacillus pakistanensis]|uniref:Quaternary ammonium compound-resistance protein SugE n=1 Tax=Rossellomorea pakistanensis TaxID=992288 RepID=A0ABS2NGN0_9BACI|nr:multidrug efflux SMR transporter [Bacillus pakistanensis]MBM7587023.1 quaternary ammonium compound-resistance protein SugE [Bacillus pakistanensis]